MQLKNKWWLGVLAVGVISGAGICRADVDALTKPRDDLKLGFPVPGVVLKVLVAEGTTVKAGQPLIELDDREGESVIELYKLRATSDVDINAAKAQEHLALLTKKQQEDLQTKNATSWYEVAKAQADYEVAVYGTQSKIQEKTENVIQLDHATVMHDRYTLRAKFSGKVETIMVHEGEGVEANKPVLRMVVDDPLWVDASVPFDQTLKLKTGDVAWVHSKIAGQDQAIPGMIKYIAEVSDSASDTRVVRVEIPNPTGMPAGEHVLVSFIAPKSLASAASSSAGDHQ